MTVDRVCAVAPFIVSFNLLVTLFALKQWHNVSQQNATTGHNNFMRQRLHIKTMLLYRWCGVENYQQRSKRIFKKESSIYAQKIHLYRRRCKP